MLREPIGALRLTTQSLGGQFLSGYVLIILPGQSARPLGCSCERFIGSYVRRFPGVAIILGFRVLLASAGAI
jgi:hypothetical protein